MGQCISLAFLKKADKDKFLIYLYIIDSDYIYNIYTLFICQIIFHTGKINLKLSYFFMIIQSLIKLS